MHRGLLAVAVVLGCLSQPWTATAGPGSNVTAKTVVAIVDSGVNIYHDEFSRRLLTAHPASYVPGYPRSAQPLRLSLDIADYDAAVDADDAAWRGLKPGSLRYVPGTNMIGMVWLPGSPLDRSQSISVGTGPRDEPRPVLDDYQFHGTGVASVLAGRRHGTCPDCLFVLVNADDKEAGLAWAASQPWIDVISNSWGGPFGVPTRGTGGNPQRAASLDTAVSRSAAASGKIVLFGSGNGASGLGSVVPSPTQHDETYTSSYTGPPWILTIGAAKPDGQPTNWHDIPVDVIAQGEQRPAAPQESTNGAGVFYGTSCSTPVAAGVIGDALLRVRRAVSDGGTGSRQGTLVVPAPGRRPLAGALADGRLTRQELVDVARHVATWATFDPSSLARDPLVTPTTDASYAYQGFGRLDRDSTALIVEVLLGKRPLPARPEMQSWAAQHERTRTQLWGPSPP